MTQRTTLSPIATDILTRISILNEQGVKPCKRDVVSPYPWRPWQSLASRTIAYRYLIIGNLINRGFVADAGRGNRAALTITDAGNQYLIDA